MDGDDDLLERVRQRMAAMREAGDAAEPPDDGLHMQMGSMRIRLPGLSVPEPDFPPAGPSRPPCDPAAVAEAATTIGVELPPLLVRLYTEVADGGFGPGDGAVPIAQLTELWESYTQELVEAEDLEPWPEGVVPFCNIDQTLLACIDCSVSAGPIVGFEFDDLDPDGGEGALAEAMSPMAPSLADWLDEWLR